MCVLLSLTFYQNGKRIDFAWKLDRPQNEGKAHSIFFFKKCLIKILIICVLFHGTNMGFICPLKKNFSLIPAHLLQPTFNRNQNNCVFATFLFNLPYHLFDTFFLENTLKFILWRKEILFIHIQSRLRKYVVFQ